MEIKEIIGHIIGLTAIVFFFISYQVRDKKKLLLVQSMASATIGIQYLLIGAYVGFALNVVCVTRNLLYIYRDRMKRGGGWIPPLLAVILVALSLYSWEGWHSLFIMAGLIVNTLCMAYCNPQNLRKSILVSCPLIITYNAFEGAYSGILNESISIVSAIIGIIRFHNADKIQRGDHYEVRS